MSDEQHRNGDLERYDPNGTDSGDRSGRPTRRSDRTPAGGTHRTESSPSLADAVPGSRSVAVETRSASVTLVGVPTIDITDYVYDHQVVDGGQRSVALFDVENRSESPFRWQSSRTQFVGDDDYTYGPSRLTLDPDTLGPGCHTRQVQLPPGRRARVVTLVEELPPGVGVTEVIHTLSAGPSAGETERLVFSVK